MVQGSNPSGGGGSEIFCTRPDRPWGPPSLLYNGYRVSLLGVKRPGRGIDHPPPSSAKVQERVELYLYSPSGPSWPVIGWTLPFIFTVYKIACLGNIYFHICFYSFQISNDLYNRPSLIVRSTNSTQGKIAFGGRPAASSVHYTTSCKHSLALPRMGEIIARNRLSWLKLLVNRYCCI